MSKKIINVVISGGSTPTPVEEYNCTTTVIVENEFIEKAELNGFIDMNNVSSLEELPKTVKVRINNIATFTANYIENTIAYAGGVMTVVYNIMFDEATFKWYMIVPKVQ